MKTTPGYWFGGHTPKIITPNPQATHIPRGPASGARMNKETHMEDINTAVCHALGLDPDEIVSISITFAVGNYPEVVVTRHLIYAEPELVEVISSYELRAKDQT